MGAKRTHGGEALLVGDEHNTKGAHLEEVEVGKGEDLVEDLVLGGALLAGTVEV